MDYYNYDYRDQDRWMSENPEQNYYTNYSYDDGCYYDECYVDNSYDQYESYDNGYYVSYDNDGWCNNSSVQNQYYESQPSSENQERSDLSDMWDEMLENAKKIKEQEEKTDQALLNMQKRLDSISKHLNQQPLYNPSDTTQVNEVSSLSSDDFYDNEVHEPTPLEVEMVVEDCVSLDDKDTESVFESEEVIIDLKESNEKLHDLVITKVGEEFVEVNATPNPTDFKAHKDQPLFVIETKRPSVFKQPNIIIDRPLLSTIYIQNSCQGCTIDVIYGNQKERLLLFEPTDDPLISGDLVVINTIDDYVYEHTANMLSDTSHKLETCLSCFRSKGLECPIMKRRFLRKKHDSTYAYKSKMKALHSSKSRIKKSTLRKNVWYYKTRCKHSYGRDKATRLGLYKMKKAIPFDPGGGQLTNYPP